MCDKSTANLVVTGLKLFWCYLKCDLTVGLTSCNTINIPEMFSALLVCMLTVSQHM